MRESEKEGEEEKGIERDRKKERDKRLRSLSTNLCLSTIFRVLETPDDEGLNKFKGLEALERKCLALPK